MDYDHLRSDCCRKSVYTKGPAQYGLPYYYCKKCDRQCDVTFKKDRPHMEKQPPKKVYHDDELSNSVMVYRLLLEKMDTIEAKIVGRCRTCNNTWLIRFGCVLILISFSLFATWVNAIQVELDKNAIKKAVASEGIKAINGIISKGT